MYARRPISASCSAIATITCSQATLTARSPIMGRPRCICASFWLMPSNTASSASISPSATSNTKLDWCDTVLKLYDYTATTKWRGLPARVASSVQRRSKRLIKQSPLLWNLVSHARSAVGAFSRVSRHETDVGVTARTLPAPTAPACVMGDMDLLRPLALAGIPCAVVSRPGVPSLYSRYAHSRLFLFNGTAATERLLDALVAFGTAQPEPPVLFYQEDGQTLLISRHRERLAKAFRFAIAESELVEDLLDKARFQALAQRRELPVPTARRFAPTKIEPAHLGLRFPLIIKPLIRLDRWNDALGL